jgi:nucleoside-diphosphate-sugar epimerase
MKSRICIVTGGSGYIGGFLIRSFLEKGAFDRIYNFDYREKDFGDPKVEFRQVDVRKPIRQDVGEFDPAGSWIFNLAALCREPGSEPHEYFDTNTGGSETVTAYAESLGIENLFFTSTMSSYGRMKAPTPETSPQYPETAYGVSKAIGERIHAVWLARNPARRLVICRPGVIFGPGDDQNIHRMIKAVKKGYFLFPGDPGIVKAYGYVLGLVDSMQFVMARKGERLIIYNYAEHPLLPLRGMVREINAVLGTRKPLLRIPMSLLVAAAYGLQLAAKLTGRTSHIHPVRVRKVAFPTNMQPQYLVDAGFEFRYPFPVALKDWKSKNPEQF